MSIKTKKLKMDHEPIQVMAEPPRKIYHEARQKAAAQQRVQNGRSKKSEPRERNPGLPIVNGTVVPWLVPPPPPPPTTPTKEEEERLAMENLERLLASVMDPVESLSPLPKAVTNPSLPPSPIAHEEIGPFHPEAEVQRGTSAKAWAYVRCREPKYWVPAAKAAVTSEMTHHQLHEEIAGAPWQHDLFLK